MSELGGKLGFIEIPDPLRVGFGVTPPEFPRRFGEGMVACFRVAQPPG